MSPEELERAASSLGKAFRASKVTVASVLAGYLRRAHLRTSGDAYLIAKAAVDAGSSFEEAVRLAAETLGIEVDLGVDPAVTANGEQSAVVPSDSTGGRPRFVTRPIPCSSTSSSGALSIREERAEEEGRIHRQVLSSRTERTVGDQDSLGASDTARENRSRDSVSSSLGTLDVGASEQIGWFPKAFGPGDIDGSGALKLLGSPSVSLVDLLVRETAQNSWDARTDDTTALRYCLHLRTLDGAQRTILTDRVFTQGTEHVGLGESLRKAELRVLEVHDRGTSGLDGPCRNDQPIAEGVPTNFIDLVLNVGSPPDKPVGGGTYGFGKTVSYLGSHSGVVLFWTHVKVDGLIEPRLIASGFGDRYDSGGKRFTGRHWWGVTRGPVILPLTGPAADVLGNALFSEGFEPGQSGTSMMLIDPRIEDEEGTDDESAFILRVRNAILLNLWPKLVGSMDRRRMFIELLLEGERVEIPDPSQIRFLAPFVDALEAVRSEQEGRDACVESSLVGLSDIRSLRPHRLVGRLGLVRAPATADPVDLGLGPTSHHVCLMRHDAELVVKYKEYAALNTDGFQWAGVFKPESDMDPVFARAEPPAHDDWISKNLQRPGQTYVNKALTGVRDKVREFLDPARGAVDDEEGAPSVASLADRLSGLVGPIAGNRPMLLPSRRSRGTRRRAKPKVEILDSQVVEVDGQWRYTAVEVSLSRSSPSAAQVRAIASIAMENHQREFNPDRVSVVGWSSEPSLRRTSGLNQQLLRSGESKWLLIRARRDLAIDLNVGVVEE